MLKFDPDFVQSARKEKQVKGSPVKQLDRLTVQSSEGFLCDASHLNRSGTGMVNSELYI